MSKPVLHEYFVAAETPTKFISYIDCVPIHRTTYESMKEKFPGYRICQKTSSVGGRRYLDYVLVLPMEMTRAW